MKCDGCKKEIKRYRSFENEKYCYNCYMKHFTRMPSGRTFISDEEIERKIKIIRYKNKKEGIIIFPSHFVGRKIKIKFVDKDKK
jgi:hypothetical protein